MRLRNVKEYLSAIGSGWVGLMSGIASLVLFVLGVTLSEAFLIAAFVCLLVASFTAWYSNHPDLIIEVRYTVLDTNYGGMIVRSETSPLIQFATLMLYLSNTRREDNSIKSFRLIVEGYGRRQEGEIVDCNGFFDPDTRETCIDLNRRKRTPLKQGVPVEGCVRFQLGPEPSIKGHRYTLIVTDAHNFSRKLKGTLLLDYSRGLLRVEPDSGVTLHF